MRLRHVWIVALLACDRPTQKSIDACQAARTAALERIHAQQAALKASIDQIRAGRWVPRGDLGACKAKLPPTPTDEYGWKNYDAWVMDDPDPSGVAGWDRLPSRLFQHELEWIDPDSLPDTEKEVVERTRSLNNVDPTQRDDLVFLFVDEVHKPSRTGEETFAGGSEHGRAWVWSASRHEVLCASLFESATPHEVEVTRYHSEKTGWHDYADSDLMTSLRRNSIGSAVTHLVAAGPPR